MIRVGDRFECEVCFTQEQVNTFAEITGDRNPIHIDPVFAAITRFGRPIVHGFLSGAVFSKVFGMQFPGPGTVYMSQEMRFAGPVFVDEPYTARFEVAEINTEKHNGIVECTLVNGEGKECIVGRAKLKHTGEFVEE